MAIKREQDGKSWLDWPKELRERKEAAIMQARVRLEELTEFYCFMQYEFRRQYKKLRAYAHKQDIEIIRHCERFNGFGLVMLKNDNKDTDDG